MENSEPLTEATFYILLSLSAEPLHGYAIMQQVASWSEGRIQFSTGTLYGALKRLLERGWIEQVEEEQEGSRPRKAYRLTKVGRDMLLMETRRLQSLTALAQRQLNLGGG
jgi:DNA-binding PadR family transcriptional regulator